MITCKELGKLVGWGGERTLLFTLRYLYVNLFKKRERNRKTFLYLRKSQWKIKISELSGNNLPQSNYQSWVKLEMAFKVLCVEKSFEASTRLPGRADSYYWMIFVSGLVKWFSAHVQWWDEGEAHLRSFCVQRWVFVRMHVSMW